MPIARIGHGQETKDNSSHAARAADRDRHRLPPSLGFVIAEPQIGLLRYSGAKLIGAAAAAVPAAAEGGLEEENVDEIDWIRYFGLL